MKSAIWLAFGLGLILGACGILTLIGCLRLRGEELHRRMPRVIIGYFAFRSINAEKRGQAL
jgi:hypothetical protein